jgi:hypothetical protein
VYRARDGALTHQTCCLPLLPLQRRLPDLSDRTLPRPPRPTAALSTHLTRHRPARVPSRTSLSNALLAIVRPRGCFFANHAARTYVQPIQCISVSGPGVRVIALILGAWVLGWVQATKGKNVPEEKNVSIEWVQGFAGLRSIAVSNKHRTNRSTHTLHLRIVRRVGRQGTKAVQKIATAAQT